MHTDKFKNKQDDRAYILWLAVNVGFDGLVQYFAQHGSTLKDLHSMNLDENVRIIEKEQEKRVDREKNKRKSQIPSESTKPPTKRIEDTPKIMSKEEFLIYYENQYVKIC